MKNLLACLLLICGVDALAQAGSEIYLFELNERKDHVSIENGKNITNHKGYDNQPFFHPEEPLIYYSSFNDEGRSDIKYYNYKTNETKSLTQTPEKEYSPTLTLDQQFVSCIIQRDNGAQDLGKYPTEGGKPTILIDNLQIGYHVWADNSHLGLFVLGHQSGDPNELHYYRLPTKSDTVIALNIGRSLHKVPGEAAISFVHKISNTEWAIKKFNTITREVSVIATTLPGNEDMCWTPDGKILMSGESKIYWINPKTDVVWKEVKIESATPIKGITRLAVNAAGNKLAMVIAE
jgi:Tol biopolymer transport system component